MSVFGDISILEQEIAKYKAMWGYQQYRMYSPGQGSLHYFLSNTPWAPGDTVLDAGCGTGRAGAAMAEVGLMPTLMDFVPDAVEAKKLPFIEANLWGIPLDTPRFDWVYCVDVLEHIPPLMVSPVLAGLARVSRKGGYLQIACFEDGCGSLIGAKLHLTVHPPVWWYPEVKKYWPITKDMSDAQYARFVIGEPHGTH